MDFIFKKLLFWQQIHHFIFTFVDVPLKFEALHDKLFSVQNQLTFSNVKY